MSVYLITFLRSETAAAFSFILYFLQGLLMSCNQLSADYLFQQDKHYDVNYDTGDKVIQCGRHNDIFKLWLMWRSKVGAQRIPFF